MWLHKRHQGYLIDFRIAVDTELKGINSTSLLAALPAGGQGIQIHK